MRQRQRALRDARREVAQVADLLAREPRAPQEVLLRRHDVFGARTLAGVELAEPSMNRTRRLARELLEHDRADERVVVRPRAPRLESARADAIDDRREDGIDFAKMSD